MGYNTLLVVMNDSLHEIKNDKNFGSKVYDAALCREIHEKKTKDISSGGHVNAATVIASYHADEYQLVCAGGNYAKVLISRFAPGHGELDKIYLNVVKDWLAGQGYEIRRKPKTRKGKRCND